LDAAGSVCSMRFLTDFGALDYAPVGG